VVKSFMWVFVLSQFPSQNNCIICYKYYIRWNKPKRASVLEVSKALLKVESFPSPLLSSLVLSIYEILLTLSLRLLYWSRRHRNGKYIE
jgi:hypothetical protein